MREGQDSFSTSEEANHTGVALKSDSVPAGVRVRKDIRTIRKKEGKRERKQTGREVRKKRREVHVGFNPTMVGKSQE